MEDSNNCPLLQLPTEIRLLIYGYALLDAPAVTIGTAELRGAHPDIVHRLYGDHRSPHPGILQNHEPVIEARYNSSLLSILNASIIPLTPATSCPLEYPPEAAPYAVHGTLLRTNRQIREDLTRHFNIPKNRRTSLFISYPHGLHVLRSLTPHLIRQARSIHIAGQYLPITFSAFHAAELPTSQRQSLGVERKYNGNFTPNHAHHLGELVASLFGPQPQHPVRTLELRIYYPGSDSYSTVWGDDNSPTVVALRNVFSGEIDIEVWRGQMGTGVYLAVRPTDRDAETGRPKRIVSTVWRKLDEGRRGEPTCGSWIVDPDWPNTETRERAEGETVITS